MQTVVLGNIWSQNNSSPLAKGGGREVLASPSHVLLYSHPCSCHLGKCHSFPGVYLAGVSCPLKQQQNSSGE